MAEIKCATNYINKLNRKENLKSEKRFSVNNLQFSSNPNPALLVRCFEADQNKYFLKREK